MTKTANEDREASSEHSHIPTSSATELNVAPPRAREEGHTASNTGLQGSRHSQVSEAFVATSDTLITSGRCGDEDEEDEETRAKLPLLETSSIDPEKEVTKEKEEEDDGVPYDRGWAWMLVFGLFINFALMSGYLKSSGILFVELLHRFHAPTSHTSLLFTIRAGVLSICGLYVMNVFLAKFGTRRLMLTGGLLMSLSAILSSFAHELTLLIFIHSVLLAMAMAMLTSPGEVLLGAYFRKRRSLALALAKCGASVGNIAVPPFISFMLETLGLSGTLLLYGGICLNSIPAAMLFRPISFYKNRHKNRQSLLRARDEADTQADGEGRKMGTEEEEREGTVGVGRGTDKSDTITFTTTDERCKVCDDAGKLSSDSGGTSNRTLQTVILPVFDSKENPVTSNDWFRQHSEERMSHLSEDSKTIPQDVALSHHFGVCNGGIVSCCEPSDTVGTNSVDGVADVCEGVCDACSNHDDGTVVYLRKARSDVQHNSAVTSDAKTRDSTDVSDSRLQQRHHNTKLALPALGPRSDLLSSRHFDTLEGDVAGPNGSSSSLVPASFPSLPFRSRTYSLPPDRGAPKSPTDNPRLALRQQSEDPTRSAKTGSGLMDLLSQRSSIINILSVSEADLAAASLLTLLPPSDGVSAVHRIGSMRSIVVTEITDFNHVPPEDCGKLSASKRQERRTCCGRLLNCLVYCPKKMVFMLDFSLLRRPTFRLLLLYFMTSPFVNISLDYLPALASEHGVSEHQAALLVSVVGGLDLLCRLACGFLADLRVVRVPTMIILTFSALAVVVQFVSFLTSFHHMLILAVLQGLLGGVSNCLAPVLIIDFVGLEHMGKAIGFCQLASGAAMAAVYPTLGYIKDRTGSYTTVYHVIGCGMLLSAFILAMERVVKHWEKKREAVTSQCDDKTEIIIQLAKLRHNEDKCDVVR